jgi:hypothetical protein
MAFHFSHYKWLDLVLKGSADGVNVVVLLERLEKGRGEGSVYRTPV